MQVPQVAICSWIENTRMMRKKRRRKTEKEADYIDNKDKDAIHRTNYQIVKHDIVFILPSQYPSPVASKHRECCNYHKPILNSICYSQLQHDSNECDA